MIDWITENPWWTFAGVIVLMTTTENVAKAFSSRLYKMGDLEIKNLELKDELHKMSDKAIRLERFNTNLQARLSAYEANENLNKFNREQSARNDQRREAQNSREAFARAERMFRENQQRDFNNSFRQQGPRGTRGDEAKAHANSLADIKRAYRKAVKMFHPDVIRANGGSDEDVAKATIQMQKLNEQYAKDKKRWKL